ncbi:MAG TPA: TlpA disulfide reductase family protein [Pyrinomonadaceae bacterium]|jgi:thiol-disulfide isomerase/thioredoxin|nr:TlpA disulfide reductase family protein [Pyrinomonadaceae bacterium]
MKLEHKKKSFWTAGRVGLSAAVFAAAALYGSSCRSNDTDNLTATQNAQQASKPKVTVTASKPAPGQPTPQPQLQVVPAVAWETEINAVGGGSFKLSDYKDKTVILDLWATWCGPCRAEIPHLVELHKEYAGKNVEVIGLTTEDPNSASEAVAAFAKEFNINYKLGWARGDVAQALMNGRPSIPQTFVIAPGGKIIVKFMGYSDRIPEAIRAAIKTANDAKMGD